MNNRPYRSAGRIIGGSSRLPIRRIVLGTLCVLAACGHPKADSGTDEEGERKRIPLRFVRSNVIRLDRRAPFSMFQPTFVAKVGSRVLVAESDASRVFSLNHDGSLVHEKDLGVRRVLGKDASAILWIEFSNSSLQTLTAAARRSLGRISDQTRGACLLSDSIVLTYENAVSGTAMTRTRQSDDGVETTTKIEVPFFRHRPTSWMLSEAVWAGDGRRTCAAASIYSYGISVYDGNEIKPRTIEFIERVGESTVLRTVDTVGPSITTTETVQAQGYGARDIAISNDSIYVLFVGKALRASRRIDLYSASQLGYLGTYEHYARIEAIAASQNEIVLLTKDKRGFQVEIGRFLAQ